MATSPAGSGGYKYKLPHNKRSDGAAGTKRAPSYTPRAKQRRRRSELFDHGGRGAERA